MGTTKNHYSKSYPACLFDLDGVLVDTAIYHYQAWKRLANSLGFDFTEAQNEHLKGVSRIDSLKLILGWGGVTKNEQEIQDLATIKNNWYVEMISKMTPAEVLPGALEFLQSLKDNGFKTALGSASKNSAMILERTNLAPFFNEIVDGNTVTASKPNPEVFLKGAELLNESAENCVVFEDAVAGVQAGKAAGMKVVGIGSSSVLKDADLIINGLNEMDLKKLKTL
ncbi:beta-phosphoglucomutase [Pedobacter sp. HMF7647]|uniref:Beta-phosphoglucomutase n=1 Tax=Hufsiella arboris TaxID=2695275 RepID=A0A7K1Y981_9SPHI|nr:beta-phosphoglucomutase [Hufsiella arboris]MXV50980.1 beta-phosphoglucomutase [Hufsiella arboris]